MLTLHEQISTKARRDLLPATAIPVSYKEVMWCAAKIVAMIFLWAWCFGSPAVMTFAQVENANEVEAIEFFNKGQDAHEKGELMLALDLYEKALKALPQFPEAELQRGKALLALGRLDESEKAFRRATELREDWSLAFASLGSVLVQLGKLEQAGPILKRAIELDPENTPALVATAELAVMAKSSESDLRAIYRRIVPKSAGAKPTAGIWAARAALELALSDRRSAALSAKRSLEIDPRNISMLTLLADLAISDGDAEMANGYVRRIESIDASAAEIPFLKARILFNDGDPKGAIEIIDKANAQTAVLLEFRKQIAASVETDIPALEKQLESEPRNIVALSKLCSMLRKSEPLRAIEFCKRAGEVEPNNIEHSIGTAAAMLQAKMYSQAAALLRNLVNAAPENYTVRANLATALFQIKLYNEAIAQFNWMVGKQPSNAVTYFFLAVAYDGIGEYRDAMANYQLFLRLADEKVNQLEIEKVNLRLPTLQKQLDAGKARSNTKQKQG